VGQVEDTSLLDAAGDAWVIDGTHTTNLYVQYTADMGGDASARFRVGVRNLTDETPPLSSNGYLGSLYNPYGRYWYGNVRVSF
jgi:outer membrane receptor protein involved in Fe transport